jgi:hypothetical protein
MPNNRRGFGGIEYLAYENANGEYFETFKFLNPPRSGDELPVGGIYVDASGNVKMVQASATNLLANGGFESGMTGWTISGSVSASINTDPAYCAEGAQSLNALFPSSGNRISRTVALTVGKRYQVSGKVWPIVGVAHIRINETVSDKVIGFEAVTTDPANPGFANLSFEFVAAVTGYTFAFGVYKANDSAYYDDLAVREII